MPLFFGDITERKRAEEALFLQATISNNISEGVYIIGLNDGVIRYTNPKFEKMFGYEPGEMIGKHVSIVNARTDKTPEETAREIMEILRKTGEWHGEVNNIKKDGTLFWCYANVSIFNYPLYGEVLISVHNDITEHIKLKKELQESETKYRSLVENIKLGIFRSKPGIETSRFIEVNHAMEELFGYSRDELLNLDIGKLYAHPNERMEFINQLTLTPAKASRILQMVRKDGAYITVSVTSKGIKDETGRVILIDGTVEDVTERQQAEEALRDSETRFRTLFETMAHGIICLDATGPLIYANPAALNILGVTFEQLQDRLSGQGDLPIKEDGSEIARDGNPVSLALKTGQIVKDVIMGLYNPREKSRRWISVDAVPQFRLWRENSLPGIFHVL